MFALVKSSTSAAEMAPLRIISCSTAPAGVAHSLKGQVMVGLIIGIGTAVAIAVGGIAWGVIRQQAAHDQGVAEAEQRLAPVVVQAPPPMPPMPAATASVAPPATAPAEAAPPHR